MTATEPAASTVIPVIRGTAMATQAEADLAGRLAGYITAQGIAGEDIAAAVAGSLVTSGGFGWAARHLGDGAGSQVLRDAAAGLASDAHLTLEEWADEEYLHGHGENPPRRRKRAPMTTEGEAA